MLIKKLLKTFALFGGILCGGSIVMNAMAPVSVRQKPNEKPGALLQSTYRSRGTLNLPPAAGHRSGPNGPVVQGGGNWFLADGKWVTDLFKSDKERSGISGSRASKSCINFNFQQNPTLPVCNI